MTSETALSVSGLGAASAPDETTVLRFRHLLEKHGLCDAMLDGVNLHLEANGIRVTTGTIVNTTIIIAPSSPMLHPTVATSSVAFIS